MTEEEAMAHIYKILDSMKSLGWKGMYIKDANSEVNGLVIGTEEFMEDFKEYARDQVTERGDLH
jgi:hypothetical protein